LYVTFDVTERVQSGKNALGVVLGNGRFFAPRGRTTSNMPNYGYPKLLLNLHLDMADGTSREIVSDESWRLSTDGPILANNEYDGEEYDARKELGGWSEAGFDDAAWTAAEVVPTPSEIVSAQMIEPIRVTESLR